MEADGDSDVENDRSYPLIDRVKVGLRDCTHLLIVDKKQC